MKTIKTLQREVGILEEEVNSLTYIIAEEHQPFEAMHKVKAFWDLSDELVNKQKELHTVLLNHEISIGGEKYTLFGLMRKMEHMTSLLDKMFEVGTYKSPFINDLKKDLLEVSQEIDLYTSSTDVKKQKPKRRTKTNEKKETSETSNKPDNSHQNK